MNNRQIHDSVRTYKRRPWSIRRRLIILYVVSAFGILFLSTIFMYWVLNARLQKEDGEFLTAKIGLLREILREQPNNSAILMEEVEWERAPFRLAKYYARILGADHRTIIETKNMDEIAPANVFPPPTPVPQTPLRPSTWKSVNGHTVLLMSALANIGKSDSHTRVLQLALDISHEDQLISDYRGQLLMVLSVGILLAALAGISVASRGLKPIKEIARTVQHISASQLHERLGQSNWPLELNDLAFQFDKMLDRIEESFNRLSQFSADLAHELRTPINNLIGETEVALSRDRSGQDYREVLESGLEEYSRLSHVIENLLFIARAESPETQIARTPFSAREQAEKLIEFYDAVAEEQGITMTCSGDSNLSADQTLFRHALSNIISNSLQHTSKGGRVSIEIKQNGEGGTDISVVDDGSGIDPKHLPRIFDRFYRANDARSEKGAGSGLGLAIVKSIMQMHHGTASIESAPGKGTKVTLKFPS